MAAAGRHRQEFGTVLLAVVSVWMCWGGADTFACYRETRIPGGYACAQSYHWGMQCVANVRGDETVEDYIA